MCSITMRIPIYVGAIGKVQAEIMQMPSYNRVDTLSCLHTVEYFTVVGRSKYDYNATTDMDLLSLTRRKKNHMQNSAQ